MTIPSTRLRLGDTWIGLLCSFNPNHTSLSVINIVKSMGIQQMLEFYKTGIDIPQPVFGQVYSSALSQNGARKRVTVSNITQENVTLTELDSNESYSYQPGKMSLETVTPRAWITCPAVVSVTPSGRMTNFTLPDTLVMLNVTNYNSVKLVQVRLRVSPSFIDGGQVSNGSKIKVKAYEENIISVEMPRGQWSSNDLIRVRDMALISGLGLHSDDDLDKAKGPSIVSTSPCTQLEHNGMVNNNTLEALSPFNNARINIHEKVYEQGDEIVISSPSILADIHLEMDIDQSLTILSLVKNNVVFARLTSASTSFQVESLENVDSVTENHVYMYSDTGDCTTAERVVVRKINPNDQIADVYHVDNGKEMLCHYSELYKLEENLLKMSPACFKVAILGVESLKIGDTVNGKLVLSIEEQLELQVVHQ